MTGLEHMSLLVVDSPLEIYLTLLNWRQILKKLPVYGAHISTFDLFPSDVLSREKNLRNAPFCPPEVNVLTKYL
jgi:hypothetical protein